MVHDSAADATVADALDHEFASRFAWRRGRQLHNLRELVRIAHTGGTNALDELPGLFSRSGQRDALSALQHSILLMWLEATECFVFGQFQSCVLDCGAVAERCLRLAKASASPEYVAKEWTLGKWIGGCEGEVEPAVLDLARQLLPLRNCRAHANMERAAPQQALLGGDSRGVQVLGDHAYLIEPYRGSAEIAVSVTYRILRLLYGRSGQCPRELRSDSSSLA